MNQNIVSTLNIQNSRLQIRKDIQNLVENRARGYVCAINANTFSEAILVPEYHEVLKKSLLNFYDGSVLAMMIGHFKKEKIEAFPGPDLFLELVKNSTNHYFLGSSIIPLKLLSQNLKDHYGCKGEFYLHPLPYEDIENFNFKEIANEIKKYNPNIIWLSLGAPKQEKFAQILTQYLDFGIIICVGAAFDFYANFSRANEKYRQLKLEWLDRLLKSPHKTSKRLLREVLTLIRYFSKNHRNL